MKSSGSNGPRNNDDALAKQALSIVLGRELAAENEKMKHENSSLEPCIDILDSIELRDGVDGRNLIAKSSLRSGSIDTGHGVWKCKMNGCITKNGGEVRLIVSGCELPRGPAKLQIGMTGDLMTFRLQTFRGATLVGHLAVDGGADVPWTLESIDVRTAAVGPAREVLKRSGDPCPKSVRKDLVSLRSACRDVNTDTATPWRQYKALKVANSAGHEALEILQTFSLAVGETKVSFKVKNGAPIPEFGFWWVMHPHEPAGLKFCDLFDGQLFLANMPFATKDNVHLNSKGEVRVMFTKGVVRLQMDRARPEVPACVVGLVVPVPAIQHLFGLLGLTVPPFSERQPLPPSWDPFHILRHQTANH